MTARMWQVHIAKVKPHIIIQYGSRLLCPQCHYSKELQLQLNLSQ